MSITSIPFLHDEVSRINFEKKSPPAQIRAGVAAFASLAFLEPTDETDHTTNVFDGVPVIEDPTLLENVFVVDEQLPPTP